MNPEPAFILNSLALFVVASGLLSNLTVIVVFLRGRPAVRKDEFDEHKSHDSARFDGLNKKFEALVSKQDTKLDKIIEQMGELAESIARHEGKLEAR